MTMRTCLSDRPSRVLGITIVELVVSLAVVSIVVTTGVPAFSNFIQTNRVSESAFDVLGTTGIEHPEAVTAGIAQALITTATGLGIAIFTVFPYNYFNSRVEGAALSIEKYATSLEIVYEKLANGGDRRGGP